MGWHLVTDPAWIGPWVAERIGGSYHPGCVTIGLLKADAYQATIVAGVMFEQWNGRSIVAHIAIERMTPAFLAAIFHYPFIHCGAHKIICPVASSNARSIALASKMGFSNEATIRDADPRGDLLLFTLCKSDCRFLENSFAAKIHLKRALPSEIHG